jgi:hypothetical protein
MQNSIQNGATPFLSSLNRVASGAPTALPKSLADAVGVSVPRLPVFDRSLSHSENIEKILKSDLTRERVYQIRDVHPNFGQPYSHRLLCFGDIVIGNGQLFNVHIDLMSSDVEHLTQIGEHWVATGQKLELAA